MRSKRKFSIFAWSILGYNLLVIAWGAYVRATGSGAGCGAHWPLCNGVVIPQQPQIETLVEFSHRLSSGLTLVLVILLVIWAWRAYSKGDLVRKAAAFTLLFTLTEAAVGAGLVLLELVAKDTSAMRAISIGIHLVNTYLLLAALALTAWWSTRGIPARVTWPGSQGILLVIGLTALLTLGASGAITALGDTLFPSASLTEGLQQDLNPTAHFLIRLRVWHPVIAVTTAVFLFGVVLWLRRQTGSVTHQKITAILLSLFTLQLGLGATNIILLAPVWLQMIHLVMSDLIWVSLILTTELWFGGRVFSERLANQVVKIGVERRTADNP